jgi:heptosyltransferase-2
MTRSSAKWLHDETLGLVARTWPVTRRKQVALGVFDAVAKPVASLLFRDSRPSAAIERILLLELWHMGDVVLATPVLQKLRQMYPAARITLLAKAHASDLLENSGLVDEIVPFDFPWTATANKYAPSRYDRAEIAALVRSLKAQRFDLSLDCRMDLRSNILTKAVGASRRVGYDFGGGGYLLTDALEPPPADQHKVDDWMGLLAPLADGPRPVSAPSPRLTVTDAERAEARRVLESYDVAPDEIVLGVHPGGSHEAKRWSPDRFAETARNASAKYGARVLVFVDPDGCGSDMQAGPNAIFVRTSIREMMALLTLCDVLLCNDSGPMHIAAALGVPVVAVFRTGSPSAYGPRGVDHIVVGSGGDHGVPDDVSLDEVIVAVDSMLAGAGGRRAERRGLA